jgi:hypothetical protein
MRSPLKVSLHDFCEFHMPLLIVVIMILGAQAPVMMMMPKLTFIRLLSGEHHLGSPTMVMNKLCNAFIK